ncbi:hypothetical protein [Henriciella sp.]|uniref:hypothetical protein n=1 Tax=Henriciella sp. TaxID=1968823 RepID=UPI00262D3D78|nr:hypothetical protein [Henriciella sp.]
MKRLLVAIAAAALPFTASASPELVGDWGAKASDLRDETASLIAHIDEAGTADIPDSYEIEILRFAAAAQQLGHWVDGNDGPSDLGCIFRGMAEEGEVQLDALSDAETPRTTRQSLVRLATMFSDAEVIAVAATHSSSHEAPAVQTEIASCPASAAVAKAALG